MRLSAGRSTPREELPLFANSAPGASGFVDFHRVVEQIPIQVDQQVPLLVLHQLCRLTGRGLDEVRRVCLEADGAPRFLIASIERRVGVAASSAKTSTSPSVAPAAT